MQDLVVQGYADKTVMEKELVPALEFNYSRGQGPILLPMKKGRFI